LSVLAEKEQIFLSYKNTFLELNKTNGKPFNKLNRNGSQPSIYDIYHAGHPYRIKNAWKIQTICANLAEHIVKEILRPSYFLDCLMGLFSPEIIVKLTIQNISIAIIQKQVYAIRKIHQNQWFGVEVLSPKKLGDPVILDEQGNIIQTLQQPKKQQIRINRCRRFDTKILAAFTP